MDNAKYHVVPIFKFVQCDYCFSVAKLCLTLWDPMRCSMQAFPVLHCFDSPWGCRVRRDWECTHAQGQVGSDKNNSYSVIHVIFLKYTTQVNFSLFLPSPSTACVCVCVCVVGGGIFSTLSKYEKETRKQILVVVILSLNHIQVLASFKLCGLR